MPPEADDGAQEIIGPEHAARPAKNSGPSCAYASFGFEPCEPFGSYVVSPFSVCMTRRLDD